MSGLFALDTQLRLVGAVLVTLGLAHIALPRALDWPTHFTVLPALTRRIVHLHTFFIGVMCVLLGLVPLVLTAELLAPDRLGIAVLAAECVFWGLRWCAQFVAFPAAVWRTSRLYVTGYVGTALLWTWIVGVFGATLVTIYSRR